MEDKDLATPEQRKTRIFVGSGPEPKTIRMDKKSSRQNQDELRLHQKSCLSNGDAGRKGSELSYLLQHAGIGMGAGVIGAILLFIVLPGYASGNAVIPGGTALFFLGGIVTLLGGPGYALYRLYDFFAGTRLSAPVNTVKTFVRGLDDGNWGRIWKCLTPRARESFGNPDDYKKTLKKLHSRITERTLKNLGLSSKDKDFKGDTYKMNFLHSFRCENIKVFDPSESLCTADFDLIVEQIRTIDRQNPAGDFQANWSSMKDGEVVYPYSIGLVLHEGKWLLTSNIID